MNNDIKNGNHISTDDMIDFFCANKIDTEYLKMTARVNAHVSKCKECKKTYDAIHDASEALDRVISFVPENQRIKLNLIKGFYMFENEINEGKKKLEECISLLKDISISFKLRVVNYGELASETFSGGNRFYHPAFSVSVKSRTINSNEMQAGEIKSALVDDESNRITIGADRTLSLYMNKNECFVNSVVFLIPADEDQQPYFEYAAEYDEKTVVVRFDEVEPGDYFVAYLE